ncbi:MAG: heavy-metal-associated domain-containing protein [Pseudomonas sp.]
MTTFEVKDMTCGHCVNVITKAVLVLDPIAKVQIDLQSHRVQIESASVEASELSHAIMEAGYSPVEATTDPMPAKKSEGGCCCH